MNIKTVLASGLMACVTSTAMAQSLDPVRIEMFRSILAGNECVLSEATAANILPRFDFDRDETRAIVGALVAAGEVRLDGNTLHLIDGSCASADPVADLLGQRDVQQFIAVMSENGCQMTEDDGEEIFTARGITKDQVGAVVGPMVQNGMASFDSSRGLLMVSSAYCTPVSTTVAAAPAIPGASDLALAVAEIFNANGCMIPVIEANGLFVAHGLEIGEALQGVGEFIATGAVTIGAQGEFVANSTICKASQVAEAVPAAPAPRQAAPIAALVNDGSPESLFISVMAQNGCSILEETAQSAFPAAGLRMDQAYMIVDRLVASGEVTLSADNTEITVSAARCVAGGAAPMPASNPATPAPVTPTPMDDASGEAEDGPREALLAMLAANNCEITQANAAEVIAAAGLEFNPTMQALSQMMADGTATTPDGGQTLQVGAELCQPMAAAPATPREAFINLLKQNNCSVSAAEFGSLLPVDGLDATTAFAMISELEAEGVITLPATRDVVTLSAENCR